MEWKKVEIIPHTTKKEVPVILDENENIVYTVDNASIYHRDQKTEHQNGYVILTSIRVFWVSFHSSSKTASYALSLSHEPVIHIEPLQTGLMGINSSPKILITLGNTTFRLSFHSGKRDEILSHYKTTLLKFKENQRKHITQPQQQQQQNQQYFHQQQQQSNITDLPPSYQYHQQQQHQHQQQNQSHQQYNYNNYNQYSPNNNQYFNNQQQQQQNNYNPYSQSQSPPNYYQQQQPHQQNQYFNNQQQNNYNPYSQSPPNYQQQQQQQQQQQPLPPPAYPNNNNTNKTFNTGIYSTPATTRNDSNNNNEGFTSNAGIGGILKQMNKKTAETDKLLNEAFSDLTALMDKAKDMVNLSQKLKITLEKKDQEKSSSTSTEEKEEEEFRTFLLEMGIESPVTKKTAKSKYHQELAKELSNWIIGKKILTKQESGVVGKVTSIQSGMISLPDLYCIFNRARGIELISPDDLYRACILFEQLDLPFRIRKFDSGVLVIQSKDENDELVALEILDIITNQGPISAFDLSKLQSISLNLAKDKLQASEKIGKLCRDETIEGITFHANIFV